MKQQVASIVLDKVIQGIIDDAKKKNIPDAEIKKNLKAALKNVKISQQPPQNKYVRCISLSCKVLLIITMALVTFLFAASYSESFQKILTPIVLPNAYYVLAPWRKIALFLVRNQDPIEMAKLHTSDCLVDNPFYLSERNVSCEACDTISQIDVEFNMDVDKFVREYQYQTKPLKSHVNTITPLSYGELREKYFEYAHLTQTGVSWMESPDTDVNNVTVFMRDNLEIDLIDRPSFHAEWHSKRPGPMAFMRKFFPLPSYIPTKAEIGQHSVLLIDSATTQSVPLPKIKSGGVFYVQGYGTREIHFIPQQHCFDVCKSFSETMETGDVLHFDGFYWKMESRAPANVLIGQDMSIGYIRAIM